jgi:hypothetical protein
VNRLGELFIAVLAVKNVLGHSGSSRHIIAPSSDGRPSVEKLECDHRKRLNVAEGMIVAILTSHASCVTLQCKVNLA